jgi:hypothetical protein
MSGVLYYAFVVNWSKRQCSIGSLVFAPPERHLTMAESSEPN